MNRRKQGYSQSSGICAFMLDTNLTLTKQKEDCYKAPVRVSCCLIAFACPSAPARRVDYRDADLRGASPIDVQTLTQAMIGEQAGETSLLGLDFGADPGSPIKFTSTIDLVNMSYSFATVPGSMYEGQALTMKGTGVFDPTTEIMTISSSTTLGSASFTSSGTDTIYLSANPKVDTDDIKYVPCLSG